MNKRETYLWLYGVVGCGNSTIDKIDNQCNNIEEIFDFSVKTIYNLEGVRESIKKRIVDLRSRAHFDNYIEDLYRRNIIYTIIGDSDYPEKLQQIYDAPKVLYYKGNIDRLNENLSIAIVGSRKNTIYGKECTKKISSELTGCGVNIISGLAIGIDAIAHEACVNSGGYTVGVLGSGLDKPLPKTNIWLMNSIVENGGAVISEHSINKIVKPYYFASRNRIISGLSEGVVIVEAAEKSGAVITAELAAEHGRNVFAVPGSIFSDMSRGCHKLIKDGAKPVSTIEDIIEEYSIFNEENEKNNTSDNLLKNFEIDFESSIIIKLLKENGEMSKNKICETADINIERVNPIIEKLKLYDIIFESGNDRYNLRI